MEKAVLTKISHPPATLRDMVQERMREAIIEGHFKPGERLVERPLCEQLGVSRTVVRETIRYLEAEGLVEILPGKGPIVAPMSLSDARQIFDIRRMLETAAARECAQNMTPARKKALNAALKHLQQGFHDETPGALFRSTADFYSEIFDRAGHFIAWGIVQRLNGRISRLRMMTISSPDRRQPGPLHMQAICDAITSGNPEEAEAAVRRHLEDTSTVAERILVEEESE